MTFSILVCDPQTGTLGGAAATGNLCVGGWVLRGKVNVGLSASQGASPSTFWGEDVLEKMKNGQTASKAVASTIAPDSGKEWRQLSAVDSQGTVGVYNGSQNLPVIANHPISNGICAGNMLTNEAVLPAMAAGFETSKGKMAERLIEALIAGQKAGGDNRGLQSAALLILSSSTPPLTLRIDYSESPIDDLVALYQKSASKNYYQWTRLVPTLDEPEKSLD